MTPPWEARRQVGAEDDSAGASPHPANRSTGRPTHTPRDVRHGDHPGRPGAVPPAPGRPLRARTPWALAIALALLLATSWQVADNGPLLRLDEEIRDAVARMNAALPAGSVRLAADHTAHAFSDLGGWLIAVPFLLGCALLATWWSRRRGAGHWWLPLPIAALAAVLIPLLVVPAKAWFARPGPGGWPLLPGQSGWYPSGHTTTATITYGTAALLLSRAAVRLWVRTSLRIGAALLSLGVGVGLLWCDYHWFLDVLAGWCLSYLVLWGLGRLLSAAEAHD